jgi:hypothetical protein
LRRRGTALMMLPFLRTEGRASMDEDKSFELTPGRIVMLQVVDGVHRPAICTSVTGPETGNFKVLLEEQDLRYGKDQLERQGLTLYEGADGSIPIAEALAAERGDTIGGWTTPQDYAQAARSSGFAKSPAGASASSQ